jgi:hypothetical protein
MVLLLQIKLILYTNCINSLIFIDAASNFISVTENKIKEKNAKKRIKLEKRDENGYREISGIPLPLGITVGIYASFFHWWTALDLLWGDLFYCKASLLSKRC